MADLKLRNINKIYPNGYHAVTDLNLDIEDGEFIVFVGPSGCGKSTTLRMIAGLEGISEGDMILGGKNVTNQSPSERNIAMVFQNYALYGHMTVYENIGFGLTLKKVDEDDRHQAILEASEVTTLTDELNKKPGNLSGGQRQRVALGRAIVRESNLFLLDEPLSNLDAKLRAKTRHEILELKERLQSTTIYVTHDQIEAMTMADRIVIMDQGVVQQVATPKDMYEYPENVFVARFIGSPAMNVIELEYSNNTVKIDDQTIELPAAVSKKIGDYKKNMIYFGIRPEHISNVNLKLNQEFVATIEVGVVEVEMLGDVILCGFKFCGQKLFARLEANDQINIGDRITVGLDLNKVQLFNIDNGRRLREGE